LRRWGKAAATSNQQPATDNSASHPPQRFDWYVVFCLVLGKGFFRVLFSFFGEDKRQIIIASFRLVLFLRRAALVEGANVAAPQFYLSR